MVVVSTSLEYSAERSVETLVGKEVVVMVVVVVVDVVGGLSVADTLNECDGADTEGGFVGTRGLDVVVVVVVVVVDCVDFAGTVIVGDFISLKCTFLVVVFFAVVVLAVPRGWRSHMSSIFLESAKCGFFGSASWVEEASNVCGVVTFAVTLVGTVVGTSRMG